MGLGEQRLEQLLELGRSLVGDLDLELVLKRVLEAGRELTGARYAALGILDSRREQLEQVLTVRIDEPTRRELGDHRSPTASRSGTRRWRASWACRSGSAGTCSAIST